MKLVSPERALLREHDSRLITQHLVMLRSAPKLTHEIEICAAFGDHDIDVSVVPTHRSTAFAFRARHGSTYGSIDFSRQSSGAEIGLNEVWSAMATNDTEYEQQKRDSHVRSPSPRRAAS